MAITSRGPVRTASPLAERQAAVTEDVTPQLGDSPSSAPVAWSDPWPDDNGRNAKHVSHSPTDAEILAAVAKSKDLELITGAELLEAIDATRVAGLVSEHELNLVRWEPVESPDSQPEPRAEKPAHRSSGKTADYLPSQEEIARQCERIKQDRASRLAASVAPEGGDV